MKYNNEYTNLVNKLDTSDEFKRKLIEKIKEDDLKKGVIKINIKNKITALIASLGIITCTGVAYATVVPEEIKNTINSKISAFFQLESNEENEYDVSIQEETFNNIITSDKENIDDYSQLTDPDVYGIGDSNGGTLIETNYKQYDWNTAYDKDGNIIKKTLEKYKDIINIKLGQVNYTCWQYLAELNTVYDKNGKIIESNELSIEEILEYQHNEFNTNWKNYYYEQKDFNEKLYFKITGMLLMNGNNSTEEDYYNNARAKKIKITFDEKEEKIIDLADTKELQLIDLQYIHYDISKPVDISIEVLEIYEGETSNNAYIADIQFGISSNIPMGR